MAKTIILVHGRSFKPSKPVLKRLWLEALRHGIARDRPRKLAAFDRARKELVYFGHLSNEFLSRVLAQPVPNDTPDRKKTLEGLKAYGTHEFSRRNYKALPAASPIKEGVADTVGALLGTLHLGEEVIGTVAPDMKEYWNLDSEFGSEVRQTMVAPLKRAMNRGDKILVIAHSLGSMISYDTFWKFSRAGEYRPRYTNKKVDLWITIGSPLGDETVKRHLRGARAGGERKFPSNVRQWINVASNDDYIAHDQKIANDYKRMVDFGLVESIRDERIYNLAVREGGSNPHHSSGYLIHPVVADLVAGWV